MNREGLLQNPLPVDRVARRSVFGKADHWEPALSSAVYSTPPAMIDPSEHHDATVLRARGHFVDLRGRRWGDLLVIGLADVPLKRDNLRWVCRCVCGGFTLRYSKAITRAIAPDAQCERCERKRKMRNAATWGKKL
jgi:hypothetical protein